MLTNEQKAYIDSIGDYSSVIDYAKFRARHKDVKSTSSYFCFMEDTESGYDEGCFINITSVSFFDEAGYLDDCKYDGDDGRPELILPYFLYEVMESTYESSLDWLTTREKMLELGFVERSWETDNAN